MIKDTGPNGLTDEEIDFRVSRDSASEARPSEPPVSPEILAMYQVPGYGEITTRALTRYQTDKSLYQNEIKERTDTTAEISDTDSDPNIPEPQQIPLIETILQSDNPEAQVQAAGWIAYAPEKERSRLIELSLKLANPETQLAAARTIWSAPKSEKPELIEKAFQFGGLQTQHVAAMNIMDAPEPEQPRLRELVGDAIEKAFQSDNPEVQINGANLIIFAPESERGKLIGIALKLGNTEAQISATRLICVAPKTERAGLIREAFSLNNQQIQIMAAERVLDAPMPEITDLRQLVSETIEKAFQSDDPEVQINATKMIKFVSVPERIRLAKLAEGTAAANGLVAPPLYDNQKDLDSRPMARQEFDKDGSETFLLGGDLKDKVIIRRIEIDAFSAWQKAYESYSFWGSEGFDYIPVEPILSFRPRKDRLVDVAAGVLDLSLADYINGQWGKFNNELSGERDKIVGALTKLGVAHGHTHDKNFCLRFFRDENGFADLNKKPRIYVIDFDQAVSPDPNDQS